LLSFFFVFFVFSFTYLSSRQIWRHRAAIKHLLLNGLILRIGHKDDGGSAVVTSHLEGHVLWHEGHVLLLRHGIEDRNAHVGLLLLWFLLLFHLNAIRLGGIAVAFFLEAQGLGSLENKELLPDGHGQEETNNVQEQGNDVYDDGDGKDGGNDPRIFLQQALGVYIVGTFVIGGTLVQKQDGEEAASNRSNEETNYLEDGTDKSQDKVSHQTAWLPFGGSLPAEEPNKPGNADEDEGEEIESVPLHHEEYISSYIKHR